MVEVTPNPDSTVKHIETDSGKPTKVFYNWLRNITRIIGDFGDIVTHDASEFALAGSAPTPARFSVYKDANQTGVANATPTTVTWPVEFYDIGSHFASNVWTPPAGPVALSVGLAAVTGLPPAWSFTAANFQTMSIIKNGSTFKSVFTYEQGNSNGTAFALAMEDVANGTDTYGVQVNFNMTGATAIVLGGANVTWFTGHWISP